MSLRNAIASFLADKPAAAARFQDLQEQGLRAAQRRPSLFVDADAYDIPDIPVRVDGLVLWAAGDIPLNDFLAVSEGRMTELEVAVGMFRKHHSDIPEEILKENLGMVQTLKIIQDVMARISSARDTAQEMVANALDAPAAAGGFAVVRPSASEEKAPPVIPFAAAPGSSNGSV